MQELKARREALTKQIPTAEAKTTPGRAIKKQRAGRLGTTPEQDASVPEDEDETLQEPDTLINPTPVKTPKKVLCIVP